MRNRVINGCCRVAQRGSVSLTSSNQYGQVDRMIGGYVNGSAGTLVQETGSLAADMTFKRALKFSGVTLSSGYITFRHRIEALNTLDLSGQTVTVSAKIYHDYGADTVVTIGLRKASASDNFTTTSTIGTDVNKTIASATTTTISGTFTLGSTDGSNGIEIVIFHESKSVTTKNFVIGDIELQLGLIVGPFERRPVGTELQLCQRYFAKTFLQSVAPAQAADTVAYNGITSTVSSAASSYVSASWTFPVTMRGAPTITTYNPSQANANFRNNSNNADYVIAYTAHLSETKVTVGTGASVPAGGYGIVHMTASAEL